MNLPIVNAALKMDGKGRIALPTPLNSFFSLQGINQLIGFANAGPKGGLALYQKNEYNSLLEKYRSDPIDPKSRLFALAICSTACTLTIDGSGRILIPINLRELLGFKKELHIFSAGSWLELWDHKQWETVAYPQSTDLWNQINSLESFTTPSPPSSQSST